MDSNAFLLSLKLATVFSAGPRGRSDRPLTALGQNRVQSTDKGHTPEPPSGTPTSSLQFSAIYFQKPHETTLEVTEPIIFSVQQVLPYIKKAWNNQATSFGISLLGLTLRPYLSRGFPFDNYIIT
ncbi:MAG: hypothetical protein SPG64_00405 [Candidatus Enteromonas sp.]|nr:hypothetical protein [Candidatus Enteromonas sp.]